MREFICRRIQETVAIKQAILADEVILNTIQEMVESICKSLCSGGKVIFAGNGGSFADSIHLAAELVGRFTLDRSPLAAVCLGANNCTITAIGNDYTFTDIFVRELRALAKEGDIFIGISTSGNSENIISAANAAKEMGLGLYAMTGESGGKLDSICPCLKVPSDVTARIQESHITIGHIVCELVEACMFSK